MIRIASIGVTRSEGNICHAPSARRKVGAARADRVDARIPAGRIVFRSGDRRAIDQGHGKAGARERRRERQADEAGAGDHDVETFAFTFTAGGVSTSIVWC